jgi:cell division protein FtsL
MRIFLRHRLLLLWMVLAVAACAVALVFFRHATARDEIAARSAAAVAQERRRAVER